ncbi:MAG: type II secretion system protein M [Betaproteobacteria bacterium]|nr:type II secretion system protein M [Betaproteobacteria bacterium]
MRPGEAFASWRSRTAPREQALIGVGALLVAAALAWAFVVDPLARATSAAEQALRDGRAQLAQARAQAAELAAAAKAAPRAPDTELRPAVERALAQRGLLPALTALQAKDRRIELTFEAIDFAALTALVDALGREARLFPVEALLAARTAPGSVRAEVAFAREAP